MRHSDTIDQLRTARAEADQLRDRYNEAMRRLGAAEMQLRMARDEIAMLKDRWQAAEQAHEATIAHFNEIMSEGGSA